MKEHLNVMQLTIPTECPVVGRQCIVCTCAVTMGSKIKGNKEVAMYAPEEISAMLLAELMRLAKLRFPNRGPIPAVVTVPAYFTAGQRTATQVFKMKNDVGFIKLRMLAFAGRNCTQEKHFLAVTYVRVCYSC